MLGKEIRIVSDAKEFEARHPDSKINFNCVGPRPPLPCYCGGKPGPRPPGKRGVK